MSLVLFLFFILLLEVPSGRVGAQRNEIMKLSEQKADAQTLKALLTPCKDRYKLHHGEHCGSRVEIKAWLDMNDPQTKFLIIDEVYDVLQKKNFRVLHPYMLQVSNIEQSLTVPLNLKQIVEISCEVKESVHRRQSDVRQHVPNRSSLIFYVPPPRKTTTKPCVTEKSPESSFETLSGTYSVEKQKFQLKLNPRDDKHSQVRVVQIDSPRNAIGNINNKEVDDVAMEEVKNEDQKDSRLRPDYEIYDENVETPGDNAILTQQDPQSMKLLQDEIPSSDLEGSFNYQDYGSSATHLRSNHIEIPQRLEVERPKFEASGPAENLLAQNNRMIEAKSNLHKKRLDDRLQLLINRYSPGQNMRSIPKVAWNEDFSKNDANNRQGSTVFKSKSQAMAEPVDKEDDPNLLVQRKSIRFKNSNINKARRRVKRVSDELEAWTSEDNHNVRTREDQTLASQKFSVNSLGLFRRDFSLNVQIFRKQQENWLRILPDVALSDEASNFTRGDLKICTSLRTNSQPPDFQKVLLLAPMDGTAIESFMEASNESELSTDEIRSKVCLTKGATTKTKRSVIDLHDFGYKLAENNAIVDCGTNLGIKCLRLQEIDAPTLKLEIQIPFTNNEVIDPRESSVKIANIFVDTSDGSILYAQFEITSKDHITKAFNLTFTGCRLLASLNTTHSVLIPPNKTVTVNLTIPLPFYAERTQETCQANIVDQENRKIAQRNFPLDPRGSRCLCLWSCKCFCFGSFLTIQLSDLCNVMSPRGEFIAGFYDEKEFEEVEDKIFDEMDMRQVLVFWLPLAAFGLVLFAGFVKAILGCCSKTIGSWLFNFVYPLKKYSDVGCCSHFLGNLFLFFLLPFAGCISLCFCRSNADERFGSDESFLGKKLTRRQLHYDEESDFENEDARLLRPTPPSSDYSAAFDRYKRSSETVFDVRDKPFASQEDEIEDDTNFVVNAIKESHESLRKLESHHSQADNSDPRFSDADAFVKQLLTARVVYRRFDEAVGSVEINPGQSYTIRGYFIPSPGTGYQFMTYNPIRQVYRVTEDNKLTLFAPQVVLDSKAFRRSYANKIEVYEVNDLSTHPTTSAPCINVQVQDSSMYASQ